MNLDRTDEVVLQIYHLDDDEAQTAHAQLTLLPDIIARRGCRHLVSTSI
jgi:hypothetical protein